LLSSLICAFSINVGVVHMTVPTAACAKLGINDLVAGHHDATSILMKAGHEGALVRQARHLL